MPQLNEALLDVALGSIFMSLFFFDIGTLLDQHDDAAVAYAQLAQL